MSYLAIAVIGVIIAVLIKSNMCSPSSTSSKKSGKGCCGCSGHKKEEGEAVAEEGEAVAEEAEAEAEAPLTPEQIETLQSTWAMVVPIKERAAEIFYGRLFQLDPSVKPLFKGDMTAQGEKLMTSINLVITSLQNLGEVVPALQDLGKRHVAYGVTAEHYDTVGAALLWTLEQGLGDTFTEEVKDTWAAAYGVVAGVMIDAAYPQ